MMRMKRMVSLLLALVMTLQMLPVHTHAHEAEEAAAAEAAAAETFAPMETEAAVTEEEIPATEPVFTEAETLPVTEAPEETTAAATEAAETTIPETEAVEETLPAETETEETLPATEEATIPVTEEATLPETEPAEETSGETEAVEETIPDISMEAAAAASGSCGTYAKWSLSDDGVLTISGSGAMTNYTYDVAAPWTDYASSIKEVVIQSGITSIGSRAFWRHSALTKATIASTVTSIGDSAFYDAGLAEVTIPSNVKTIGGYAFYSTDIASINIPASVTSVGNYAFESCGKLKQVHITDLKAWCGITFGSATSNPTGRSGGLILNGEELTELVIPSGVTKIGDYAFYNCSKLTSVTIPSGVKSIGSYAFYYCQSLTSVTVPSGVTSIGSCAFYYCIRLASASLPNTVTSLGSAAFNGCRMLTSVDLPTGLTLIDSNTFYGCEKLESVTIPSGVTEIGYSAFHGCKALKQVVIPSKVTKIGDYAFQSCEALESVTIPSGVTSIGNYAFYYCGALTGVTLPNSLTSLGYGAFSNCVRLETISIPAALTSIGSGAFSGCTGLKKITVSASNTAYSADSYGVLYDKNKTVLMQAPAGLSGSYSVPNTVRTIDGSAFYGCSQLTAVTIPSGVTEIGSSAFANCTALTAVVLPETVTSLGYSAFSNCESLVSVNIPKGVTALEDYTFYYCKRLAAITIPEGVTEIGSYAFRGCAALKSIVIPDSVKTMYYDAFADCASLESVTIGSGITRIESMCFQNCAALKEVVIPDSVEQIYDYAFCNCSSLESVTIGSGVEYIGSLAFYDCEALETIRFRGPAPDVGDRAFDGITATAYYPYGEESWNSDTLLDYGGRLTWVPYRTGDVEASGTCGEGLTWSLLDGEIWIEGSGEMADYSQTPAPWSGLGFTALRIGEHVRSIGASAFSGCAELTKIIFLGDAPAIGENAFEGVTATADYYVGTEAWENAVKSGYGGSITWNPMLLAQGTSNATTWTLTNYGLLTISGSGAVGHEVGDYGDYVCPWYRYSSKVVDVVVGPQITELGDTFWNDGSDRFTNVRSLTLQGSSTVIQYTRETTGLESITVPESHSLYATVDGILYSKDMTQLLRYPQNHQGSTVFRIPDSVTTIGNNAFAKCQRLTEVIIPGTVTSMGGGQNVWQSAFPYCVSLEKVTLGEGIEQIGGYAFYNCTALTDVVLPESLTGLGSYAFGYCTALTEIALPESVTTMGTSVFYYCKALREVALPEGITEIPNNTFYNCTSLEQVTLGSQITKIGTQAFYSCKALAEVKIPATVTDVGNNAFLNCENLMAVRFFGDAPNFGTSVFRNAPSLTVYYYANNATWTGEVRQAAGADVNWKGVCGSGHTLVTTPGIPATCTQPGISDGSYCSECTLVLSERQVVPAAGHSFADGACTGCGILGGDCGTNVTWSLENGILTVSGTGAMTNYGEMPWGDMRESIVEVIIQPGVTAICPNAFDGCENMVKVTIPDTVTRIDYYAFEGCRSLAAVEIPDSVTAIGDQAFVYCESLTTVTIPGSVKGMLHGTFLECTSLTSAVIGGGVEELYATFLHCSNLAEIRFLGAAPEIYFLAASYYDTVPLTAYYPYGDPTWTDEVLCDYGRPITWVPYRQGEAANSGSCGRGLTWSLDQKGTLWIEGEGAMEDYSASNPAPWNGLKITAVRVDEGVTRIGSYAFRNCTSLTKIEFAGEAPIIGTNAFYGVLASAEYPAGSKGWDTVSQNNYGGTIIWTAIYRAQGSCGTGVSWKLTMDGVLTVTGSGAVTYTNAEGDDCAWWYNYAGQVRDVVVGPNITDMGEFFFTGANADSFDSAGFVNLRSITLQGSKTAFTLPDTRYMPALESITIPSGNSQYATVDGILYSADKKTLVLYPRNYQGGTDFTVPGTVTAIGDYAFHKAATLVNVTIPDSVTAVGEWAFSESTALETVTMGDGVAQIGTYAFYSCKKLRSVTLGSGVESIGKYAFYSCKALEELDLGGARVIGERAFSSCTALTELNLPDTLEEIGAWAFSHCDGLTAVDVSSGVETIGNYAFGYCGNLTEVRLGTGVTSLGKYVFSNSKKLNTLRFYGDAPVFEGNLFSNITVTAYYYAGNATWTSDVLQDYGGTITWKGVCGSGHTPVVEKAGVTATCTEDGLSESSYCADCRLVLSVQQVIPAKGHSFENNACTGCGIPGGSWGEKISWILEDGVLTISGEGAMADAESGKSVPWYSVRTSVKKAVIERGITTVGDYAFFSCAAMQEAALPEGIVSIGEFAFAYCDALTSVTIPGGVETIGENAFAYSDGLTSVTIPASVKSVGTDAFEDSNALREVHISDLGAWAGISFSNDRANPTYYTQNLILNGQTLTELDIPAGTKSIGSYTFVNCTGIVRVTIPDTVTTIGEGAFVGCAGQTEVTLGDSVSSIGPGAFYKCSSLTALRLPDGLTYIGSGAFGYSGLKALYIPSSVTSIPETPFSNCNKDMVLYCGAGSRPSNWSAEWNVYNTNKNKLSVNWGVSRQAGDFWTIDAFAETVVIPSFITEIPRRAFYCRTDLTSVTIPDTVTGIGDEAFKNCTALTGIEIPDGADVGSSAFYGCTGLTEILFRGDAPESMGNWSDTFYGVTASAYYPASNGTWTAELLKNYGGTITWVPECRGQHTPVTDEAVAPGCDSTGLTEGSHCGVCGQVLEEQQVVPAAHTPVTDEAVEPNCTQPGWTEGSHCENCGEILKAQQQIQATGHDFDEECLCTKCGAADLIDSGSCGENVTWQLRKNGKLVISGSGAMADYTYSHAPWYGSNSSVTAVVVEKGVTGIGDNAFEYCYNLTGVTIADSVKRIGERAFLSCTGLTEIVLPGKVTEVGDTAFDGSGLTKIDIPDSVVRIGTNAFRNCTALAEVTIGSGVTSIGDNAFACCDSLVEVTIPDSVTSLGTAAFYDCGSLVKVKLGNGLTAINDQTFYMCTNLGEITFGSNIQRIGEKVFYYNRNQEFRSLRLPDSLKEIGANAFMDCYYLRAVYIPEGVTTISADTASKSPFNLASRYSSTIVLYCEAESKPAGWGSYWNDYGTNSAIHVEWGVSETEFAFWGGTALKAEVAVPTYITEIHTNAFNYREDLVSIQLHDGITAIGDYAFNECAALTEVTIPQNVKTIGNRAFANCDGLTELTVPGKVTSIGEYAFGFNESLQEIRFQGDAPRMDSLMFNGVTATAYYPANKSGWTSSVLKNYGGTITWVPDCQGQHTPVTDEAVAPGCDSTGLTEGSHCGVCGQVLEEQQVVPAAHTPVTDEAIAPTCTQSGWTEGSHCDLCGEILKAQQLIPASHTVVNDEAVEATCTRPGLTAGSHCSACGEVFEAQREIQPAGHDFADGACANCDAVTGGCGTGLTWLLEEGVLTVSGSGAMDGYSLGGAPWYAKRSKITAVVIGADVTAVGSYAFAYCSNLKTITFLGDAPSIGSNAFYKVTAEAFHGGSWPEEVLQNYGGTITWTDPCGGDHSPVTDEGVEATCTQTGLTAGSHCESCGKVLVKQTVVDALDHDMGPWEILKDPTCTEEGSRRQECRRCGHSETEGIVPNGHNYESTVTVPGCETQGYTSHLCLACGHSYVNGYTDPVGHNMGIWKTVTAATCTKEGQQRRECSRCEFFETGVLDALGHDLSVITTVRPATCREDGEEKHGCSRCDFSETVTVEATGHDYESVVTKPGCETGGQTTHTCRSCGFGYTDSYTGALGHDLGAWETVEPATCTAQGSQRRNCSRCGHYETKAIDAKGHTEKVLAAVEPTCTQPGLTEGTVCTVCEAVLKEQQTVEAAGHDFADFQCRNCGIFATASGTLNGTITWYVDSQTGQLVITGTGTLVIPEEIFWEGFEDIISRIVIGEGITAVTGTLAEGLDMLTSITIPATLTSMDPVFFDLCGNLVQILVEEGNPSYSAREGILFSADGTELIRYPGGRADGEYTVPGDVDVIHAGAFSGNDQLHTLRFTGSMPQIGEGAFAGTNVTVYYPGDDPSWDPEQLGGVTWIPEYEGSEVIAIDADRQSLLRGQTVTLTARLNRPGAEEILWEIAEGGQAAELIPDGETALLTAGTVSELTTVTVRAWARDGGAKPAEIRVEVLPQVRSLSLAREGETVTGKTVWWDMNAGVEEMTFTAKASPAGASGQVDWTISDGEELFARYITDGGSLTVCQPTGRNGMVTITATAADGSGAEASFTLKFTALKPETEEIPGEAPADVNLLSGKSKNLLVYDETTGKALTAKEISWSMDECYAPFAKIDAKGKLTAKTVVEKVRVEARGTIAGSEGTVVIVTADIFPAVTSLELTAEGSPVGGKTLPVDANGGALVLTADLYPLDAMEGVDWVISDKKSAFADYTIEGNVLTVAPRAGAKAGSVTVKVTSADGSKKTTTVKLDFGTYAQSVTIDRSVTGLTAGDKAIQLSAAVEPAVVTKPGVVWSLKDPNDKNYVNLTAAGKITPKAVLAPVDVTVVAASKDGMAKDEHTIRILPKDTAQLVIRSGDAYVTKTTQVLDVNKMESITLSAHTYGEEGLTEVEWSPLTAKGAILTKQEDGSLMVQMTAAASVNITAKAADGRKATVTVKGVKLASSVEIAQKKTGITEGLELASGQSLDLEAKLTDAAGKKVTWSMARGGEYAAVSNSGKLTAAKDLTRARTVAVRAEAEGGAWDEMEVTLRPIARGVQIYSESGGRMLFSVRTQSWWVRSNTTLNWDPNIQGETISLNAHVYPYYGEDDSKNAAQAVTWTSSAPKVARIETDADGGVRLVCVGTGSATITATAADGSKVKVSFKLNAIRGITHLALEDQRMLGGKKLDLSKLVVMEPADTTNKKLNWQILEGGEYVSLTNAGALTAKKGSEGKQVRIRVTPVETTAENVYAECTVTIYPATTRIEIFDVAQEITVTGRNGSIGIAPGADQVQLALKAVAYPYTEDGDAFNDASQELVWTSSNSAYARVEDGMVTLYRAGIGKTVTITVTSTDGSGKKASVKLRITEE